MREERNLNYDKLKEHYTKYIYFLISLCIAGIGFSFQQNKTFSNSISFYLWLSSISLWGLSILGGLLIIETNLKSLSNDVLKFDALMQHMIQNPNNKSLPKDIEKFFEPEYKKLQIRLKYLSKIQNWGFYLGFIIYIIFFILSTPITHL